MQTRTKYKTREIKEQDNDEYLKKRENLITGVPVFFFFFQVMFRKIKIYPNIFFSPFLIRCFITEFSSCQQSTKKGKSHQGIRTFIFNQFAVSLSFNDPLPLRRSLIFSDIASLPCIQSQSCQLLLASVIIKVQL